MNRYAYIVNNIVVSIIETDLLISDFPDIQQNLVSVSSSVNVNDFYSTDQTLINNHNTDIINSYIEQLWIAANDYQSNFISGAALSPVYDGYKQALPKSTAVVNWINSIWTEYYTRKATITSTFMPSTDFSSLGSIPYTVPEVMTELGMTV